MRIPVIITGLLTVASITTVLGPVVQAKSQVGQYRLSIANSIIAPAIDKKPASEIKPQAPAPKIVEVQPNDSLVKIATDNDTTFPRLYSANEKVSDPNVIYPGDKLRIPTADEHLVERLLPAAIPEQTSTQPSKLDLRASAPRSRQTTSASPVAEAASDGNAWDALARCESGGNWSINTGNGFSGGLQFTQSSWNGVGGSGSPNQASREEQIARAEMLRDKQGWGAWPACSAKLGLR